MRLYTRLIALYVTAVTTIAVKPNYNKVYKRIKAMQYSEILIDYTAANEYGLDPIEYFVDAGIKFILADGGNTIVLHEPMSEDEIHSIAGPALDNELIVLG